MYVYINIRVYAAFPCDRASLKVPLLSRSVLGMHTIT